MSKFQDPYFKTNKIHNPCWNIEEIRDPLSFWKTPLRKIYP